MPNDSSPVHYLKDSTGALTIPVHTEATYLVLQLNERGIELAIDGDDLLVTPRGLLTERDRAALVRLKAHVRHALAYQPPGVH